MVYRRISSKRQAQKEQEKWERQIIDNWKSIWYAGLQSDKQTYRQSSEDCFAEWLDMTMHFLRNGKLSNKRRNFWMKAASISSFFAYIYFCSMVE